MKRYDLDTLVMRYAVPAWRVGLTMFVIGALLGALSLLASGCSTGPQLPVVTVPMSISCSWHAAPDGGHLEDNDCLIDRSSAAAEAETTGNRARDVQVSPDTNVSAIP